VGACAVCTFGLVMILSGAVTHLATMATRGGTFASPAVVAEFWQLTAYKTLPFGRRSAESCLVQFH